MSNRNKWAVAGAVSLLALGTAPLMAQDYSGAFTFGYSNGSVSVPGGLPAGVSVDVDAITLHGTLAVQFPDGFRMGARMVHISPDGTLKTPGGSISATDLVGNIELRETELNFGYTLASGAWFGVYSEDTAVSIEALPLVSISHHSYGIEGGTNFSGVDVRGFVGSGNDVTSYGVSAQYATNQFVVGGNYMHSDVSLPGAGTIAKLDNFGIAGAYQINPQFGVFAGVARTTASDAVGLGLEAGLTSYGLGVSYDMSSLVNMPLIASVEYGGTKLDVTGAGDIGSIDGFTLGVTIPMGNNQSTVPANSVAGAVLAPTHNVISQTALMSF